MNSLRTLRFYGDYKLSNYNTIPHLRIRVLSFLETTSWLSIKKDKEKYFGEKNCSSESALKLPFQA